MTTDTADELRAEVAELRGLFEGLRADIRGLTAVLAGRVGPRDGADQALIQAIAETTKGLPFTSRELFRHGKAHAGLGAALLSADLVSARQIGKFFARVDGLELQGVCVERVEVDRDGSIVWRCRVCGV